MYSIDKIVYLLYFTCSVVTKHRGYLMQTLLDKEVYEWLYAINPLLAGQIRYVMSRYYNKLYILCLMFT